MAEHPGAFIREELAARDWLQADFAAVLGKPPSFVSGLLSGKKRVTVRTARLLEAALGVDAATWLNLQAKYDLEQGIA